MRFSDHGTPAPNSESQPSPSYHWIFTHAERNSLVNARQTLRKPHDFTLHSLVVGFFSWEKISCVAQTDAHIAVTFPADEIGESF